jgi:hypothetical protein
MSEKHRRGRPVRLMLSTDEHHRFRMASAHINRTMSDAAKHLVREFVREWEQGQGGAKDQQGRRR